jgi:hypothetical protein
MSLSIRRFLLEPVIPDGKTRVFPSTDQLAVDENEGEAFHSFLIKHCFDSGVSNKFGRLLSEIVSLDRMAIVFKLGE